MYSKTIRSIGLNLPVNVRKIGGLGKSDEGWHTIGTQNKETGSQLTDR